MDRNRKRTKTTLQMKYIFIFLMYEVIRPKLIWLWYYLINYNDRK
jgi:hypothetical protein